jgi:Protein of unknown function (DUF1565)
MKNLTAEARELAMTKKTTISERIPSLLAAIKFVTISVFVLGLILSTVSCLEEGDLQVTDQGRPGDDYFDDDTSSDPLYTAEAPPVIRCTGSAGDEGCVCRNVSGDGVCDPGLICNEKLAPNSGALGLCITDRCLYDHPDWPETYWPAEDQCIPCYPCDSWIGEGETGELWPITDDSSCICETEPDYYQNGWRPKLCDMDGDGWVTRTARTFIEDEPDNSPWSANARCQLKSVDRFILKREDGTEREIMLPMILDLYEPAGLDDETDSSFPTTKYGDRQFRADELNPMTKACVNVNADFNANGVSDFNEWDFHDDTKIIQDRYRYFSQFSYFMELHRGYYEFRTDAHYRYPCPDCGQIIIEERNRLDGPSTPDDWRLSFHYYESDQDSKWRQCGLYPDTAYDPSYPPPTNIFFDYAMFGPYHDPEVDVRDIPITLPYWVQRRFSRESWELYFIHQDKLGQYVPAEDYWLGMTHNSQFKCAQLVDSNDNPEEEPHKITLDSLDVWPGYIMNTCTIGDTVTATANPADPTFDCEIIENPDNSDIGMVGWRLTDYEHYETFDEDENSYKAGCNNECWESQGYCGLCGLGYWECETTDTFCGPDGTIVPFGSLSWECGAYGVAEQCINIDFPSDWDLTEVQCDDKAYNSSFFYVSKKGKDGNDGSRQKPFKTIGRAIDEAVATADVDSLGLRGVIVGQGEYEERVTLVDGVSIYGGFAGDDIDGDGYLDWYRYPGYETVISQYWQIRNADDLVGTIVTVDARDVTNQTILDGLTIIAETEEPACEFAITDGSNLNTIPAALEYLGLNVTLIEINHYLYVSNDHGDDGNDGSCTDPLATIPEGYTRDTEQLALDPGIYAGGLVLEDGINLIGGFEFGNTWHWSPNDIDYPTLLISTANYNDDLVTVFAENITSPTLIQHLQVETVDNPNAQGSNYGILFKDCDRNLQFEDLVLEIGAAGNGDDGLAGTVGDSGACLAGGAVGAGGTVETENGGGDGEDGENGTGSISNAGKGCVWLTDDDDAMSAVPGLPGDEGFDGSNGVPGSAFGNLDGNLYYLADNDGTDAYDGGPGTGGGGGGGGCYVEQCSDEDVYVPETCCVDYLTQQYCWECGSWQENVCGSTNDGGDGGLGGTSGCGGEGGTSGAAGGGAFGLYNLSSSGPRLVDVYANIGKGGDGGRGGDGATGGTGAVSGTPGTGGGMPANVGGPGGVGGLGGKGGDGGGGGGGPSFCFYQIYGIPMTLIDSVCDSYEAGSGGDSLSSPGANGRGGEKNW